MFGGRKTRSNKGKKRGSYKKKNKSKKVIFSNHNNVKIITPRNLDGRKIRSNKGKKRKPYGPRNGKTRSDMKYNILGQGTYGCVLQPALGFKTNKNFVSKITIVENKKTNESKISKKLSKLKNSNNYFCLILDSKTIKYNQTPKYLRDEKFLHEPDTCEIFGIEKEDRKTQKYISKLMNYGGNPLKLDESINHFKNINIFISFIRHLLTGLKMTKTQKILLGDIKLENILINKNNMPRLIDLDHSQIISSKISGILNNINDISTTTGFISPELTLLKNILSNIEIESNTKKEANLKKKNFSYKDIDYFLKINLEDYVV